MQHAKEQAEKRLRRFGIFRTAENSTHVLDSGKSTRVNLNACSL